MNKFFTLLSFITLSFVPFVALGATDHITSIEFEKDQYFSYEEARLFIDASGINQANYLVDIYVEDLKNDGYKIRTVDLGNQISTDISIETINLASHGIFKGGEYFNIFMCKSGTKCSMQSKKLKKNVLASTVLHVSLPTNAPSVDLKVNDKDNLSSVKWDDKLTITWTSKNSKACSAYGNFLPDDEGGFWAGESPFDKTSQEGVMRFYSNLQPTGEVTVYAHPTSAGTSEIHIGVSCLNETMYQESEEMTINLKGSSRKQFKKPTPMPLLDITSPKEGQTWNLGKVQKIKWKSEYATEDIAVKLYSFDEGMMCNLDNVSKKKKNYSFTLSPNLYCDSGLVIKPGKYMLEIQSGFAVSQLNPLTIK